MARRARRGARPRPPGHDVTREAIRTGLRAGHAAAFPWHRPEVPHPELGTPDAWWAALEPLLVGAYRHVGVRADEAAEAAALVRETFTDPRAWSVFPDTRSALVRVRTAGRRTIVLSNHVPELPRLVRDLGLDDLIDDVLTSAATGYEKPNPAMYRLALQRAGAAEDVWMIGDNPVADVAGARAVGIRALLVRTPDGSGTVRGLDEAVDIVLAAPGSEPPRARRDQGSP